MLILLHGGNTFASLQALDKLTAGKSAVVEIDGSEADSLNDLLKDQDTFSLLGDTPLRTTVIKRIGQNSKKKLIPDLITELEHKNPEHLNLIFWEDKELGAPDRRGGRAKSDKFLNFVKKKGEVKTFTEIEPAGLSRWLVASAAESGVKFNPRLADEMVFIVGTNQQMLAGELEKLLLFIKAEKRSEVGKTDLEILTVNEADAGIWELTDALATRNRTKILGLANKIMQTDQDFHQILLPMIARQIKILFLAKQFPADQLVRDFKLHPYAVKKAMEQARSFEVTQLKQIFNKIINLDYAVKQGKIEPRLGLNLLLSTV